MGDNIGRPIDPSLGLVQLLKIDLTNDSSRVNLNEDDMSKLGAFFYQPRGSSPHHIPTSVANGMKK